MRALETPAGCWQPHQSLLPLLPASVLLCPLPCWRCHSSVAAATPCPPPQPRAGCQEAGSHSCAREPSPQEERLGVEPFPCHVPEEGEGLQRQQPAPIWTNGGRTGRTNWKMNSPGPGRPCISSFLASKSPGIWLQTIHIYPYRCNEPSSAFMPFLLACEKCLAHTAALFMLLFPIAPDSDLGSISQPSHLCSSEQG